MGVRVGNGAQVGAHAAAYDGSARDLLQGSRRAVVAPQALRLVLAVPRGLDQSAGDVHPRRRVLLVQAWHRHVQRRSTVHAAVDVRSDHDRPGDIQSLLDANRADAGRPGSAEHLLRLPGARLSRLHRAGPRTMAKAISVYQY